VFKPLGQAIIEAVDMEFFGDHHFR